MMGDMHIFHITVAQTGSAYVRADLQKWIKLSSKFTKSLLVYLYMFMCIVSDSFNLLVGQQMAQVIKTFLIIFIVNKIITYYYNWSGKRLLTSPQW